MAILRQLYTPVYEYFNGDPAWITIILSIVTLQLSFWLTNATLLCCDITGFPRWLRKYKVQPDQNVPVSTVKLLSALKTIAFNVLVLSPAVSFVLLLLPQGATLKVNPDDIPSAGRIILELAFFTVIQEILFYYSHRLLHHPYFYKRIHKKHHEWTAPIGVVAVYAHPVEHLLSNIVPVMAGPTVLRSHIVTKCIWITMAIIFTIFHHSGYHLPFMPSPQFHDYHHLKFNVNYGTLGWLDWFHGTDKLFRQNIQLKRHRTLLGTRPIHEIFPEKSKSNNVKNGKQH